MTDLTLTGIDLAENADELGIRFIRGDILKLEIAEQFDVVVSVAVMQHTAEVKSFLQRMRQLARPYSTLVFNTLNDGSLLYSAARLGVQSVFLWLSTGCTRCITCIISRVPRSSNCSPRMAISCESI